MKSNSYLGAHVGWKVVRAFTVQIAASAILSL
jgi:hypothetical protein